MRCSYLMGKRFFLELVGGIFLTLVLLAPSHAQEFPSRTITMILPYAPGGGTDILLRKYADVISKNIKHPVIVQNMPAGGGLVGATTTLNSGADGYTMFLASPSTHAAMQSLQIMPFDPLKDFKAVSIVFYFQNVLVVSSSLPIKSIKDLAAYGKSKAGGLVYGTPGNGSAAHILAAMVAKELGFQATATHFRNGPALNLALAKGELDFAFGTFTGMAEFVKGGQVNVLAVVGDRSGKSRVFPEYPTFTEAGFPKLDGLLGWHGLVVPAATPDAIVQRLSEEIKKASKDPGILAFVEFSAFVADVDGSASFAEIMRADTERYKQVIPPLGISTN